MPESADLEFEGHPRNIQYTTSVARLLNQTETGVAKAISDEPENFLERQYGRLIGVVDVASTSDTYEIGEVVLETARREFYSDLNRSVADSFEHALTVINQTLADLAADGQHEWVGNLNAVLAVINENALHVSHVGSAEAYLVRGHAITHITEGLNSGGGATAKTFKNVASGTLEVGDRLLVATGEIFSHLSVNDIRRHLYLHHPGKAITKIADQLRDRTAPNRLACVVSELTTIDLISSEPASDEPTEIILGAPRRHLETLSRFKPFYNDTPAAELAGKTKKYWEKKVRPSIVLATNRAKRKVQEWKAKRTGTIAPPPPRHAAGTPETHTATQRSTARSKASGATAKAKQSLAPATTKAKQLLHKTGLPKSKVGQRVSASTRSGIKKLQTTPLRAQLWGSKRVLYRNLIILAAFVLLLSLYLSIQAAQTKRQENDVRAKIQQIEAKQAKAEEEYVAKDLEKAREDLGEAKKMADALSSESVLKSEISRIQALVASSFDRINNIVSVPDQPATDLSTTGISNPAVLALSGNTIFAFSENAGSAYSSATKDAKNVPLTGVNGIVSSATSSSGDVLIYTSKPSLYQLDPAKLGIKEVGVALGGSWEKGVAIDTIQQNVLVLDSAQGQIWRHTRTLSAYNKGDGYFQGKLDLKNAIDIASGAQIYVLRSDGSLQQFVGGAATAFALKAVPTPNDKLEPKAVAVNFTTKNIYIADPKNHRVVEFTGAGDYARQFVVPAFSNLKDIVVDEKANVLYGLAGTKLFAIPLAG